MLIALWPAISGATQGFDSESLIDGLAQDVGQELPEEGHFLVTDFQNEFGNVTELGRVLAARLREKIKRDPRKKVVEGSSLRQLIKSKLNRMGYIHHSMKWQPDDMSPAEIEVHGTFTEFPRQLELRARILDSRTGDLQNNLAMSMEKTKDLYAMHSNVYDPSQNRDSKGTSRFVKAYISALFHLKEEKKEPVLTQDPLSNMYYLMSNTREKQRDFDMALSLLKPYLNDPDNVIQSSVESFVDSIQQLKVANSEFIPLLDQTQGPDGEIDPSAQVLLLRRIHEMELLSNEFWDVALKSTVLMTHSLLGSGSGEKQALKMNSVERDRLIKEVDLMFPEIQGRPYESQAPPVQCAATIRRVLVAFEPENKSVTELMLKRKYFYIGLREYMKGNYAAAITGWEICLLIDPDHEVSKEKIRKAKQALRKKKSQSKPSLNRRKKKPKRAVGRQR